MIQALAFLRTLLPAYAGPVAISAGFAALMLAFRGAMRAADK